MAESRRRLFIYRRVNLEAIIAHPLATKISNFFGFMLPSNNDASLGRHWKNEMMIKYAAGASDDISFIATDGRNWRGLAKTSRDDNLLCRRWLS